jgi:hypothetical protein
MQTKLDLFFLIRTDEEGPVTEALCSVYSAKSDDVSISRTLLKNLSILNISVNFDKVVRTVRHLNVIPLGNNSAQALVLGDFQNEKIEKLIQSAKEQNEREVFSFLLENYYEFLIE